MLVFVGPFLSWRALDAGHKYLYESLPRILTLWFDYGAAVADAAASGGGGSSSTASASTATRSSYTCVPSLQRAAVSCLPPPCAPPEFLRGGMRVSAAALAHCFVVARCRLKPNAETLAQLNGKIEKLRDSITGYKWMTVIPQLTSRICHKEPAVYQLLSVRQRACPCIWPHSRAHVRSRNYDGAYLAVAVVFRARPCACRQTAAAETVRARCCCLTPLPPGHSWLHPMVVSPASHVEPVGPCELRRFHCGARQCSLPSTSRCLFAVRLALPTEAL